MPCFVDEGSRARVRVLLCGRSNGVGGEKMLRAGGDRDREGRSSALHAPHLHIAAVQPGEFLDESQSNAGPFVGTPTGAFDAMKPLEKARKLVLRDPRSRVLDRQGDVPAGRLAQPHRDVALEGELEGVREQVEDDLLPHVAVDKDRFVERRAIDDQLQPGGLDRRAEVARQFGREGRKVGRLIARRHAPGLDAGEIQERVDQFQQPQGVAIGHF